MSHHPAYKLPYHPTIFTRAAPPSSPDYIVIPYDVKEKKFQIYTYTPHQTQFRLSYEEVERFLDQVNISLKKWHEENEFYYDPPWYFYFGLVMCVILLPLLFTLICCLMSAEKRVLKDLNESIKIAKDVIQANNSHLEDKGLRWIAPYNFPRWIELETNYGGSRSLAQNRLPPQGIPVYPQPKRPDIQTVQLAQQDYQAIDIPNQQNFYSPINQHSPMTDNQFNANMYNANVYDK